MIVGAVRHEEEHSWQEACETWEAPEWGVRASIHQVGALGLEEAEPGEAREEEQSEAEPDGLLVERDEREYILELLMREIPADVEAGAHPTRAELGTVTGKRKRNLGKKLRKKLKMARITAAKENRKVKVTRESKIEENPTIPVGAGRSSAGGGSLMNKKQGDRGPSPSPTSTSGRECTGYQEPVYSRDRRC
jgi:hypothetical protein